MKENTNEALRMDKLQTCTNENCGAYKRQAVCSNCYVPDKQDNMREFDKWLSYAYEYGDKEPKADALALEAWQHQQAKIDKAIDGANNSLGLLSCQEGLNEDLELTIKELKAENEELKDSLMMSLESIELGFKRAAEQADKYDDMEVCYFEVEKENMKLKKINAGYSDRVDKIKESDV